MVLGLGLALGLALGAFEARATDTKAGVCAGVALPSTVTLNGTQLVLN